MGCLYAYKNINYTLVKYRNSQIIQFRSCHPLEYLTPHFLFRTMAVLKLVPKVIDKIMATRLCTFCSREIYDRNSETEFE